MKYEWFKMQDILYYKEWLCCDTKSHTRYLLNRFYLNIDAEGVTTIYFRNAVKSIVLLTFKNEVILYKDFDAILNLSPRNQLIFSAVVKKHLTATINI